MKYKIQLSFLFLMMSVLASSKGDAVINKANETLMGSYARLKTKSGNTFEKNGKLSSKQSALVKEGDGDTAVESQTDYDLPLYPVSHFIFLQ